MKNLIKEALNSSVEEKRRNIIEDRQFSNLTNIVNDIATRLPSVNFNLVRIRPSTKTEDYIIKRNGDLVQKHKDKTYNKIYDSRLFDAVLDIEHSDGKYKRVFFILKGCENAGGTQDMASIEVGRYTENIQNCNKDDVHFIFILDGAHINSKTNMIDVSKKYDIATSDNVKQFIEKLAI